MREFTINKNPHDLPYNIYPKSNVTFEPGVTVLVGCNGAGKTTLLRLIKEQLKQDDIPCLTYSNLTDGGKSAMDYYIKHDVRAYGRNLLSSEGECMSANFAKLFVRKAGEFVSAHPDAKEIWFLLDALDSGTSIDMIRDIKEGFDFIISHEKNLEVFIIVAANSFEMARGYRCLSLRTMEYADFRTYAGYVQEIMRSRKGKDRREEECRKHGQNRRN